VFRYVKYLAAILVTFVLSLYISRYVSVIKAEQKLHTISPDEIFTDYSKSTSSYKGPRCTGLIIREVPCDNPYVNKDEYYNDGKCRLKILVKMPVLSGDCS